MKNKNSDTQFNIASANNQLQVGNRLSSGNFFKSSEKRCNLNLSKWIPVRLGFCPLPHPTFFWQAKSYFNQHSHSTATLR